LLASNEMSLRGDRIASVEGKSVVLVLVGVGARRSACVGASPAEGKRFDSISIKFAIHEKALRLSTCFSLLLSLLLLLLGSIIERKASAYGWQILKNGLNRKSTQSVLPFVRKKVLEFLILCH